MFALHRVPVRAARVWSQGEHGISVWEVADEHLDAAILRTRFDAVAGGRVDPDDRLRRVPGRRRWRRPSWSGPRPATRRPCSRCGPPTAPASSTSSAATLADLDVAVRSAHVDTLGPQAVDVFYLQEASAGALSETRAAEAAHAVREVLSGDYVAGGSSPSAVSRPGCARCGAVSRHRRRRARARPDPTFSWSFRSRAARALAGSKTSMKLPNASAMPRARPVGLHQGAVAGPDRQAEEQQPREDRARARPWIERYLRAG